MLLKNRLFGGQRLHLDGAKKICDENYYMKLLLATEFIGNEISEEQPDYRLTNKVAELFLESKGVAGFIYGSVQSGLKRNNIVFSKEIADLHVRPCGTVGVRTDQPCVTHFKGFPPGKYSFGDMVDFSASI